MEGGGDAASTASLEFHLGGCSCHQLPTFLLQPITVESSVSLTHQRLCDQKCHSPKHLYPLLSIQNRPNWFLVQAIKRRLNHKCSLCDFPKSLLSSRWLNAAEPLLDIQQMSSNIITCPFATNSVQWPQRSRPKTGRLPNVPRTLSFIDINPDKIKEKSAPF